MLRPARTALALVAAPLAAAALAVPSSAAVPLGTQSDTMSRFSTPSAPTGTVIATLHDTRPGHYVAAPEDGVITSWRSYEFSGTTTASLVVLERTAGTDDMRIVSSSLPVTATASWFGGQTRLPIRAGQQIGVQILGTYGFSHFFWGQNVPALDDPDDTDTGSYAFYDGLVPGGPPAAPRTDSAVTDAVFQLQAVVEPDVDGDGFGDETQDRCPSVASEDQTDTDGDGVGDACDPDIDGDGLPNADEATRGTDPLVADSDDDGLKDGDEVTRGTDPLKADSDDDGLTDPNEIERDTDPIVADTDGDGLEDGDEVTRGTDPLVADGDRDGLDDGDEIVRGTDPLVADSDSDGLKDGDEVTRGTDPLRADSDDDGIDDRTEVVLGLDPLNADTDGDGFLDGPDRCPLLAGTDDGCPAVVPPAPQLIDRPVPFPVPVPVDQTPSVAFASASRFTTVVGGVTVPLTLVALDDQPIAAVEVLLNGRTVCRATAAPYSCRIRTTGSMVGTQTLVATVRDAAGQLGTATHTLTVRPFRLRAVSGRSTTKRRGVATEVGTRGTIRRPAGLDTTSACRGRVSVQVKRGPVTLSTRRVALDRSCRFRSAVRFGSRVRSGDRLRVHVTFDGNRAVAARRAVTQTVVVR